ncbi:hypothetical protein PHYPSEUDO_006743 [Phytophthora pseudosyringae]|uniref:Uncharacterized protein n=1 Tax=Phytophthora pseudosyringae TaxID=221518 RepID=A0A8T1VL14_9STRA|nr:hypothetical protein PHYPSEUDO_006743 [Phytophthora pseudosyringae]
MHSLLNLLRPAYHEIDECPPTADGERIWGPVQGCIGRVRHNVRSVARYDELSWSNGIWDGEAVDTQRTRAVLPDELSRVLSASFRRHYLTFFPQSTSNEWSIVKTIAGAPNQPVRCDFPPPQAGVDAVDLTAIPAELLVATQDDTVIHWFGWNRLVALPSYSEPSAWIKETSLCSVETLCTHRRATTSTTSAPTATWTRPFT